MEENIDNISPEGFSPIEVPLSIEYLEAQNYDRKAVSWWPLSELTSFRILLTGKDMMINGTFKYKSQLDSALELCGIRNNERA